MTDTSPHHLYLNQVLPLMLSMQGKLVFHASAIEFDGAAIAFVARSGHGKSTLAASFALSGLRFLTDDGLVIEKTCSGYQVLPGHPSIRLWEDSEHALIPPGTEKAPALVFTSKSRFQAGKAIAFCAEPRPLRRVYFLGDGRVSAITIERMDAAKAMIEWVRNSFLLDVEKKSLLAAYFDEAANLANQPICFRLDFPRRFEALASVRQAIAQHATSEGGSA